MDALIERLQDQSHWATEDDANSAEEFSQELIALQSIYEPDNVDLVYGSQAGQPVVLQVKMPLRDGIDDWIKLQVELPITYPNCDTAPKMQLVNRTIVGRTIEEKVRSEIEQTFSSTGAVPWSPNIPVLFQGLDTAYESIQNWITTQFETNERDDTSQVLASETTSAPRLPECDFSDLAQSEVLVERKSEFLGHAIRISSPDQVCM